MTNDPDMAPEYQGPDEPPPTPADDERAVVEAMGSLSNAWGAMHHLQDVIGLLADDSDRAELGRTLVTLEAIKGDLDFCIERVGMELGAMMENPEEAIEGVGLFARRGVYNSTAWLNDDVRADVSSAIRREVAMDPDTGEIDSERRAVVDDVLAKVREVWSLSGPKKPGLKARGLDWHDYAPDRKFLHWAVKVKQVATPEASDTAEPF